MTTNITVDVPECQPGALVDISVDLTAPQQVGMQLSTWRFRDNQGELWGEPLFTRIKVIASATPLTDLSDEELSAAIHGTSDLLYIDDITIDDNSRLVAGRPFVKTWRVKNTGTTAWSDGFTLRHNKGTPMTDATSVPLSACAPGQQVDVSLDLCTPLTPGKYYTEWLAHDPQGNPFGQILWMPIFSVSASGTAPLGTAQPTRPAHQVPTKARHYSQRDPQWRKERLGAAGSKQTIGSWGCLVACFAMVASALDHDITPKNLNVEMLQKGGFVNVNQT